MYDLPVEMTQPCRHWECSSLTDHLRRSPVRATRRGAGALARRAAANEPHALLTRHCGGAQYYEPDHTKADLFWIPHQARALAGHTERPIRAAA